MRRRLAYMLLTAALVIGAGATIGSCITNLDTDVSYGAGRDLYFKVLDNTVEDGAATGVSPDAYYGESNSDSTMIDLVAEEFEYRLENWGANATVTKQGYDTLIVSVRSKMDDETEYNYLRNYLPFDGGHLTIGAGSNGTLEEVPSDDSYMDGKMFEGHEAEITYVNNVPVVTIEVNEPGEEGKFNDLVKYCKENTQAADEESGTEATNCYLVLWNKMQEGDSFALAADSSASDYDINMAKRLVFGENANQAWYDDQNNDNDFKKFQLIPNSTALQDDKFDESKAGAAYMAAVYYQSLFNASDYAKLGGTGCSVVYAYDTAISASTESLIQAGDWHVNPAFNSTMIATIVSLVAGLIILAAFYRLGTLSIVANAATTVIGTLLMIGYFSAQFGIGALAGLLLAVLSSSFGGIYYFAKMKEELYKGRTLKKAHGEAIKKSFLPSLDVAVGSILSGICVYGLIPGAFAQLGLALVLGGFFGGVANILLLRLEGWLLANDKHTEGHLLSFYGVEKNKVPNLANGEKQTYFGPLADKDLTKAKKPVAIAAGAVLLAAIAGISVFSAINGNAYNFAGAYDDTTAISIEYRVESGTNSTLLLSTEQQLQDDFFAVIKNGEKSLNAYVDDVILEEGMIHMTEENVNYDIYYFNVKLNQYFKLGADAEKTFSVTIGSNTESNLSLQESLEYAAGELISTNETVRTIYVRAQNVVKSVGTPSLGTVYTSLGVALAVMFVYFLLRFRPSRAVAATLIAGGSGVIVAGFFALTRIPVTPVASVGVIGTTILGYILSLFIFNKEKEIIADSHEKDKSNREWKLECLAKANAESAGDLLVYALIATFASLIFMGIGPADFRMAYAGLTLGIVILSALQVSLLVPATKVFSGWFETLRKTIKNSRKEAPSAKRDNIGRKKGSEPEEAIIIGIND